MTETLRLNMWSGPRNVSTALMYAFAERPDTRVVDEPLYGYYLEATGSQHPGREEILAAMDTDGRRVIRDVVLAPDDRPILFFKMMAHHLVDLDWAFLDETANILLIRDPVEVLPTLIHQVPEPVLADTAIEVQARLLEHLRQRGGDPVVLDSRHLLLDPEGILRELCDRLAIAWHPGMLSWRPGPRAEDGVWAPHWYHNVHRSTGFGPYRPKTAPFPERLEPLLEECRPYYEVLAAAALTTPRSRSAAGDLP